jgi:hypothetical protein
VDRPPAPANTMITITVLAILGFALFAVLWAMFRAPATAQAVVTPNKPTGTVPVSSDVDPWDAHKGDVISINGAAEDFSDIDFPVDRRSAYESGNRRWVDLSGDFRGRRVYLEVYRFPQTDLIGIVDGRKLTLVDVNLTAEQLADLDNRQDQTAFIEFENKHWYYDSSRELGYQENEAGETEGLYRWLFQEKDSPRMICIEKWEGEPFDVRIAQRFHAQDIIVYRAA